MTALNDIAISGTQTQTLTLSLKHIRLIRNVCEMIREGSIKGINGFTARDAEGILKAMGAYIGGGNK